MSGFADDGPAWDGEGTDPWLPARLAVLAAAVEAEQILYAMYWSELAGWLVGVARAVLHPGLPPDPAGVWSQQPAWNAAVGRIVAGPITDTIGQTYRAMLGPGYRYDSRPLVAEHLAAVTNRMVRTPDQVFNLIAAEIARGAEAGEGIPKLTERVDTVLSTTATERWPNRATVVARTESIGALNAGRAGAFVAVAEELPDDEFEHMWIATSDNRTRPTHRNADLQRVPVGQPFVVGSARLRYPGDPAGPGSEVIQCRCSSIMVEPESDIDLSNRQYFNY